MTVDLPVLHCTGARFTVLVSCDTVVMSLQFTLVRSVLPLCCYGKVLDFMIKNTRLQKKLTHSENLHTQPRKCVAMPTIDIVQLIANQRQRKREIAATLVFVCTGHRNF